MKRFKKLMSALLCATMLLSMAACGGSNTGDDKNPAGNDKTPVSDSQSSDTGTAVRETLSIALSDTPTSLDPQVGDLITNKMIWNCTHESLLGIDPATNAVIPELAKSFEISEDGLTYTFVLNEGVTFHNGETLKASDVVFTFNRATEMPDVSGRLGNLESVTAVNDTTVEMKLKNVNQDWSVICSDQLFSILSEKACTEDASDGAAIGTGPFYSTYFVENEKVSLERYDGYWGDKVSTKAIDFRIITEASARSVALQNDEVQAIVSPDPIELSYLQEDPNLSVLEVDGAALKYLAFNSYDELTANQQVRQAIACALNRDDVIMTAVNGCASPAYTMWGPNVYGYDSSVKTFDRDVEKAKSLLTEAGYPDGISIELVVAESYSIQAQMIQASLKEAGIDVKIATMDNAGIKEYRLAHKDQMCFQQVAYANNADDMRWSYGAEGSGNYGGFVVDEFDQLLDLCMSSSDESERLSACTQVQELNADLCWYIPIYTDTVYLCTNKNVTGVEVSNIGIHDFSRIACAE